MFYIEYYEEYIDYRGLLDKHEQDNNYWSSVAAKNPNRISSFCRYTESSSKGDGDKKTIVVNDNIAF